MPPQLTWLIRHGQSASNAGQPVEGHAEVPLTPLGHAQAREVALRVERAPDRIVVSPFRRAEETAAPIRARWPAVPCETWPIGELTYLSPARCRGTTGETRRPLVAAYWERCDPDYRDGPDAESFRTFLERLRDFHARLLALDVGFALVVGHGQFFRGYLHALASDFTVSPDWMRAYREHETTQPLANCAVVPLTREVMQRSRS
ncbi:MAG: histidine phosphatase family protein [Pseudomonadota bacterium]|nr:histidine phosphatase family protein [Pseudomonadota bacterium]